MDKRYTALGVGVGLGVLTLLLTRRRRERSLAGSVGLAPPAPTRLLIEQQERSGKDRVSPVARWRETRETIPRPRGKKETAKAYRERIAKFVPVPYEALVTPVTASAADHDLQEEMIGNFTVDRRKYIKELVPRKLPTHLVPYADFMVESSKRPLSPRALVKAYLLTTGSMMRSAVKPETVLKRVPYAKVGREKVRPEDVLAQIFQSDVGKAYLDAAADGQYDAKAARVIREQYGKLAGLKAIFGKQLRAAPELARKAGQATKILRGGTRRQWYNFVKKNMTGVSVAKAGFIASMLGRGDMATADAREINFWWCPPGKYDTDRRRCSISMQDRYGDKWTDKIGPETVEVLREQLNDIPLQMPRKYHPFRTHLAHHLLWEALEGQPTTHQNIVDAVQLAGTDP